MTVTLKTNTILSWKIRFVLGSKMQKSNPKLEFVTLCLILKAIALESLVINSDNYGNKIITPIEHSSLLVYRFNTLNCFFPPKDPVG